MSAESLLAQVAELSRSTRQHQYQQAVALLLDVHVKVESHRLAKAHFARELAPDFRLFDFLRTDEYGLSRCIAALLDPGNVQRRAWGQHGQGPLYLDLFLKALQRGDDLPPPWAHASQLRKVELEKVIDGQRRLDIYLEFENGAIGIENKPWAGDQENQLTDYAGWLERTSRDSNYLLVFLSNRSPSNWSIAADQQLALEKAGHFVQVSYAEITELLQAGAEKTRAPTVRLFVEQLIGFIRSSINQVEDMNELRDIRDTILASVSNLESAFQVQQALALTKTTLIETLVEQLMTYASEKQITFRCDLDQLKRGGPNAGFYFYFSEEKEQNVALSFSFEERNLRALFWGLKATKARIVDKNKQDSIYKTAQGILGPSKSSEWWPWWAWADECGLDSYRHWEQMPDPWVDIFYGNLSKRITIIVDKVYAAFSDTQFRHILMLEAPRIDALQGSSSSSFTTPQNLS